MHIQPHKRTNTLTRKNAHHSIVSVRVSERASEQHQSSSEYAIQFVGNQSRAARGAPTAGS